jgi:hypothetical protein
VPKEIASAWRTTPETALIALAITLFSGFSTVMLGAQKGKVDSRTRKEVQALIEKGMDDFWVVTSSSDQQQLRRHVDQIFFGALANEVYHNSLNYFRHATDWPAMKITQLEMTREEDGIVVFVDYVVDLEVNETHRGRAKFHAIKTPAGWRIDQRAYKED